MSRSDNIKGEEKCPASEQVYAIVKVFYDTECQILLDSGPSRSIISKAHYLRFKPLQSLPTFASNIKNIQTRK